MKRFFLCCTILFLLLGCVTTQAQKTSKEVQNRPFWIDKPYSRFSDKDYAAVSASGVAQQTAINNAYGELAKIFGTDISLNARMEERFQETKNAVSVERIQSQKTDVSAKHTVINASIVETWQDPIDKKYYALAIIPKKETAQIISQDIQNYSQVISSYIQKAKAEPDPIFAYSYMDLASVYAAKTRILERQLLVLEPESKIPVRYNADDLTAEAKQYLQRISFTLDNSLADFTPIVIKKITDLGFKTDSSAPYLLKADITYSERPPVNNMWIVDAALSIHLINKKQNASLLTFTFTAREAGFSSEAAKQTVITRLNTEIEKNFTTQFDTYLNKVIDKK